VNELQMGLDVFMWTVVVWNAKLFRKYGDCGGNLAVFFFYCIENRDTNKGI